MPHIASFSSSTSTRLFKGNKKLLIELWWTIISSLSRQVKADFHSNISLETLSVITCVCQFQIEEDFRSNYGIKKRYRVRGHWTLLASIRALYFPSYRHAFVFLTWTLILQALYKEEGNARAILITFWRLPLVYLALILVRGLCICLLNPIFRLAGSHMSFGEIMFTTVGGLRGAIALILAQILVQQAFPDNVKTEEARVTAQVKQYDWKIANTANPDQN